jgi:mycothiol synthase
MNARAYEGLRDLAAMLDLLTEGYRAANSTYYVHRGDLQWWLFYTDVPQAAWQSNIRLWFEEKRLLGWALLTLDDCTFDVFTHPSLRGDPREREMLAWGLEQTSALEEVQMIEIAENDDVRIRWLEENGFQPDEHHYVRFTRSLSESLESRELPDGFSVRTSRGAEDARLRAVASHAAFGSKKPLEEYWPRTLRFMQSPVYVPEHEIFVMSPENEVASYCIIWTDEINKLGHFEPVGTHPKFQGKGLGKILLCDGLRRLKAEGMEWADVCTNHDNSAAIRLYESVGFQFDKHLLTYKRRNKQ